MLLDYNINLNDGRRCRCCGTAFDFASEEWTDFCTSCVHKFTRAGRKELPDENELNAALVHYLTTQIKRIADGGLAGRCAALSVNGLQCAHNAKVMRDGVGMCQQHADRLHVKLAEAEGGKFVGLKNLVIRVVKSDPRLFSCFFEALGEASK